MTNLATDIKIYCSARVKLTVEQRQTLKEAYRALQSRNQHSSPPTVLPGSGIRVQTASVNTDVNRELGLPPHVVMADLLASRDAMSLPTVLLLQKVLGVEIVSNNELQQAFKDYLEHVNGS